MIICGIKLTHDASIALFDNEVLKFSIEIEKINNNPRYSEIGNVSIIEKILQSEGYEIDQVNHFVIDGWHGEGPFWEGPSFVDIIDGNNQFKLQLAGYNEQGIKDDVLKRYEFKNGLVINGKTYDYSSYMHVSGHLMSAYLTSELAEKYQNSYLLVWDGGQYPRLYYYDFNFNEMHNLGELFVFLGVVYSVIAQYFGPYKKSSEELREDQIKKEIEGFFGGYSVAGKIMAYIALGNVHSELFEVMDRVYEETFEISNEFEHKFSRRLREVIDANEFSDEDVLATFHVYLEKKLVSGLKDKIGKYNFKSKNICISGGCALNIKWNSAIRNTGLFDQVYVPPFPNDSGSAIGTACCEIIHQKGPVPIQWSVYCGPKIINTNIILPDWDQKECSPQELAELLYHSNEPVVMLNDRAELGPRALGNRSILANPSGNHMKDILNAVKKREKYRPVAPMCLEELATEIFDPGCEDPFMLFDHKVRENWLERIQAIQHIDGTARLQTINKDNNALIYAVIQKFYELSGIPVLCNTSANYNGSGFFPNVESAMKWGQLNYIWSNGTLYFKKEKRQLQ